MLDSPPLFARATPGSLDLVGDEQAARVLDDRQRDLEVLLRRHDEAAHALDRLGHERRDFAVGGGLDQRLQVLGAGDAAIRIREAHVAAVAVGRVGEADAGDLALRLRPVRLVAHDALGERPAAAVIVPEHDQLLPAGGFLGGGDRGLVGLRAGVGEENLGGVLHRPDLDQLLGQLDLRQRRVQRRDVHQLLLLLDHRLGHPRMAVADADCQDAAEEIEVLAALDVLDEHALRRLDDERFLVIGADVGKEQLFLLAADLVGIHGDLILREDAREHNCYPSRAIRWRRIIA